jgi:alkylresorcinol/alkylpyrone synthase
MRIAAVASALPEHRYHQSLITAALKRHWQDQLEKPALLDRFHSRAGVHYRHLAFPLERYPGFETWGQTNSAWLEVAEALGARAIDAACRRAGLAPSELGALVVTSIAGVASPSLDARLINRMKLRSDIKRTPIFGLGCVGGAVGVTRAADHARAYPRQAAAVLAVEVCSLTLRHDDLSTANLIASGLFADGAAAAIVIGSERREEGPRILATRSVFYPDSEDITGWKISERGFEIVLSAALPELIRTRLAHDVDSFLASRGRTRQEIGSWIIHTGGPRVLEAIQDALGLSSRELEASWDCLRRCGNLSSASILLVLEHVMLARRPAPGTLGLLLALGPGFCSEILLVRW